MNLVTVLVLTVLALILTWGYVKCRRIAKITDEPKKAALWRLSSRIFLISASIIVSVVVGSQVDVPNPFAPTHSSEGLSAPGLVRDTDGKPFAVPATNANPAKAAEDNRKLLEEVKRQQHN